MKLFEYEAKNILRKYGIAIPPGKVVRSPEEAEKAAQESGQPVFLKSQVTVAGRGKAGGILPANDANEAKQLAISLFRKEIKGLAVKAILVEEKLDIEKQLYASIVVDRQMKCLTALVSESGGIDIEEVARNNPEKIIRHNIDPVEGFSPVEAEKLIDKLTLPEDDKKGLAKILISLYKAALELDAELVELNPLVKTKRGDLIAADAKITLDDNALFRHAEFAERSLQREEDTLREAEARKQKFSYVDLEGDIGIIGNGAGLVMATVDMVHYFGGKAANFLDIGGGAGIESIKNGVLLVMNKPEVKAVLINILGGITRCDLVAMGVVEGLKSAPVKKPIVVRMMGTNETEGQEILRQNGIGYYPDMEQAAQAVIKVGDLH